MFNLRFLAIKSISAITSLPNADIAKMSLNVSVIANWPMVEVDSFKMDLKLAKIHENFNTS